MPRSGGRSKKQRTRTRLAAETAAVKDTDANSYPDLAPADEYLGAPEPEAEEPSPSPDEEESRNSSDDNEELPVEWAAPASSLAEDVMAIPSPFPPGDPVRACRDSGVPSTHHFERHYSAGLGADTGHGGGREPRG